MYDWRCYILTIKSVEQAIANGVARATKNATKTEFENIKKEVNASIKRFNALYLYCRT